ncbi:MAG: tetratricopeptide repeat protein [Chloroflexota bacterium]|nr:tetratricopeptide repeat protein [Chloroflexota bacterium]
MELMMINRVVRVNLLCIVAAIILSSCDTEAVTPLTTQTANPASTPAPLTTVDLPSPKHTGTDELSAEPFTAEGYYHRAIDEDKRGLTDLALADYTKALTLNPQYVEAYIDRGTLHWVEQRYVEALRDLNKAVSFDPENARAYNQRSLVYKSLNNLDKALADADKALELRPGYSMAHVNRGIVYSIRRQRDRAIEEFSKAIDTDPENAIAYYNRALAYVSADDPNFDNAIADLSKVVELKPTRFISIADAYCIRGVLYSMRNRSEEDRSNAKSDFNAVLQMGLEDGDINKDCAERGLQKLANSDK